MALVHTAEQAAEIIGGDCKASWLKEQARKRQVPFTMLGGSYHFTDAHLEEIIRLGEHRPGSAASPHAPRTQARRPAAAAEAPAIPLLRARTPRRRTAA